QNFPTNKWPIARRQSYSRGFIFSNGYTVGLQEDELPSLESITRPSVLILSVLFLFSPTQAADQAPPPGQLTAEQDHQRMLDLLHIKELRPGADGRNPQAPNHASYDESKANPYPKLPDPLMLKNGKKVTDAKTW